MQAKIKTKAREKGLIPIDQARINENTDNHVSLINHQFRAYHLMNHADPYEPHPPMLSTRESDQISAPTTSIRSKYKLKPTEEQQEILL